jgi:tRNA(Arg) A34 adenosine deaminase TadA/FixJ family two-component response regulator
MTDTPTATILIAEAHNVTRDHVQALLTADGYRVISATTASAAIKALQDNTIDLVLFDTTLGTTDGFDIARYVQGLTLKAMCVLITADKTSDLFAFAAGLGVHHVLAKPVDPHRLKILITQILSRTRGHPKPHMSYTMATAPLPRTPEQLMQHAVTLARKNVQAGLGGPFASVVADANGYILGEGTNLHSSRFDPVAHAEVMAIRQATEALQQPHLEGCVIISTSEPTRVARALIDSVGIRHIYFGLRHSEVSHLQTSSPEPRERSTITPPQVHHLHSDDVAAMIRGLK